MTVPPSRPRTGRMPRPGRALGAAAAACLALTVALTLVGCQSAAPAAGDASVTVSATDDTCTPDRDSWPAGVVGIEVTNSGSKVTELYVRDGQAVVAERENIAPGASAELTVDLAPGTYQLVCKPGMAGDGISAEVTVSGDHTPAAARDDRAAAAAAAYRAWVLAQVEGCEPALRRFVAAVEDGDVASAKRWYAPSRVGWESVEPVAEAFGDLDPRMDARVNDVPAGEEWTGWHRIEKALWADGDLTGMAPVARTLLADYRTLLSRIPDAPIDATTMGNGAKELLDEVATGKVTGEEERYSHTDLVDFEANVEGALKAYRLLRPIVVERDPDLARTLDAAFARCLSELHRHGGGVVYRPYPRLSQEQVDALAAQVDAVAEPLSHLTATVVGRP